MIINGLPSRFSPYGMVLASNDKCLSSMFEARGQALEKILLKNSESRSDPATLVNDLHCFCSWTPCKPGYLFSASEAAPVLCRGGARYTATIRNCHRAPLPRSFLAQAVFRLGRERTGGGVDRSTRYIAGNARHPGTRPGQPAIKDTLITYKPGFRSFYTDWQECCRGYNPSRFPRKRGMYYGST